MITEDNLKVLDLFCGAGGLSLGFIRAGFTVVSAIDSSATAVNTYSNNIGCHAVRADLSLPLNLNPASVIVGGPPCQGFSTAGARRAGDNRNDLVSRFAFIVSEMRPAAFVFENVEGFLTAENGTKVFELLNPLVEAGYRIHLRKINAANYGVPQHRKRVVAIGGLGWDPSFPQPTHFACGAPGSALTSLHLPPTLTFAEAVQDLPMPTSFPPGFPNGHFCRPLSERDIERAMVLKPGQTMRDLPERLQHESYKRRAFRRVADGVPTERRGGAPTGVRRLRPDEPSKAVTGGALSEFLHPSQNRPLTLRECARLQTFPDDFVFYGNGAEQAQLIGNAVPPVFARAIAESLATDLQSVQPQHSGGKLLSFIPTLSNGSSPILKDITTKIQKRFMPSQEEFVMD